MRLSIPLEHLPTPRRGAIACLVGMLVRLFRLSPFGPDFR